jgi:WD40 repeat protein
MPSHNDNNKKKRAVAAMTSDSTNTLQPKKTFFLLGEKKMNTSQSAIYGQSLNKARCLTSVLGDTEHDRFLVGTLSLHSDNELHLIEYKEELNDIERVGAVFSHPHEIWNISPCPSRANLFWTVYYTGKLMEASLWKLPESIYSHERENEDGDENDATSGSIRTESKSSSIKHSSYLDSDSDKQLTEIAMIPGKAKVQLKTVLWQPNGLLDRILTIDNECIKEYAVDRLVTAKADDSTTTESLKTSSQTYNVKSGQNKLFTGRWDPNHSEKVAVAASSRIIEIDLRSNEKSAMIEHAHEQQVRCLEYNAYRPYYLVSGGDDCKMKFWDIRMTGNGPLKIVCGHSHWITQVAFNPLYDQLVVSSSTDSLINLWSIPSISQKSTAKKLDQELNELDRNKDQSDSLEALQNESEYSSSQASHSEEYREEEEDDDDDGEPLIDSLVASIDEHEESVYSVAWSSHNKWVFGSVSYYGKVFVHTVPQSEKWKILNS